jgi:hypothetical protein
MPVRKVVVLAVGWAGLASCSADGGPVVGDEPITSEAIAAVMMEHVDLQPVAVHPYPALSSRTRAPYAPWPESAEGAVIYFAGVAEDVDRVGERISISAIVQPAPDTAPCEDITLSSVEASVDGHEVSIAWQDREPEEDPGIVHVIDRADGEEVDLLLMGPYITDDPRELDLGVPLGDLAALVTDPRLSVTTSQEVVDLGSSVELSALGPQSQGFVNRACEGVAGRHHDACPHRPRATPPSLLSPRRRSR